MILKTSKDNSKMNSEWEFIRPTLTCRRKVSPRNKFWRKWNYH